MAPEFLARRDRPPRGPVLRLGRDPARRISEVRSIGPATTVWPGGDDWVTTAVVRIVTTYTSPGDRVLLHCADAPSAVDATSGPSDRYAALGEAAWTVVRLGRSVVTDPSPASDTDDFALILTATPPAERRMPDMQAVDCRLRSGAVFAVMTHTEEIDGHLRDKTANIIRSARSAGLRYHDHIIVLTNARETHVNLLVFTKGLPTARESSDD